MALHLVTHMHCGGLIAFVDTEAPLSACLLTPHGRVSSYKDAECMRCGQSGVTMVGNGNLLRDLSPYPALKAHTLLARLRCSTG